MCKRSGEFVDHFLLHYDIASVLWNVIFSRVGLAWIMPKRVVDLLACWKGVCGSPQGVAVWTMVLSCFCGVFEEKEMIEVLKTAKEW
jgi:hypothetical protein